MPLNAGNSQCGILDFPFFVLEYRDGVFRRHIPADAEDLGGGIFRYKGKTWKLPDGQETAALAEKTVQGRPLLSLLNRGPNPLIKEGPRLAREERLMELSATPGPASAGAGPLSIELRRLRTEEDWLPLAGLPRFRLCQNVIYEIIDDETLEQLVKTWSRPGVNSGGSDSLFTLRGEDIPRFAQTCARLVYQFADQRLKNLLAEESVFVNVKDLSLILGAAAGSSWALPLLRCRGRYYRAEEISLRMDREYILLENQWARREDLQTAGIYPLGSYAGGEAIEKIRLRPGELLCRGGKRLAGLFSGMEADTSLWLERGNRKDIFRAHLEFLAAWGLSGGVIHKDRAEQAALLVSWLAGLETDNVLVLIEKIYFELYLPPFLAQLQAASYGLPGLKQENRRRRIAFYEELPPDAPGRRDTADILVLVEAEEALIHEKTFAQVQGIRAKVVLGVFSGTGELFSGPSAAKARNLFGVKEPELEVFLIRNTGAALNLPQFKFPPAAILRAPSISPPASPQSKDPFPDPFNFAVEEKFSGLAGPSLYSELGLFRAEGPQAPFIPLRLLKGSLDIERMDADEKAFFLYWRGEFRRGNILKTGEGYIRVFARELCLFSGGEKETLENFRILVRLWETYADIFESLGGFLPGWLVDFAVLYEKTDSLLSLLLPYARNCRDPLLSDMYIYRRFLEENNSIDFGDVKLLIPRAVAKSVFFDHKASGGVFRFSSHGSLLAANIETVINAVDRYLRERFRLRLFEFFYPRVYDTEKREAFAGMERAGRSSYTVTGPRFSKYPPLICFLEDLFNYTEYCFRVRNGFELKGKPPPLANIWKTIADAALGLADNAPVPSAAFTVSPFVMPRRIKLHDTSLEKLRADSGAVRDLLAIEDKNETPAPDIPISSIKDVKEKTGKASLKTFVKKLDRAGLEAGLPALRIIAGEKENTQAELEILARKHKTMPDLLIDKINAAFLELTGDLLIDTVDAQPVIQPEYKEELKKELKLEEK